MNIFTSLLNLKMYADNVYRIKIKLDFTVILISGWKPNCRFEKTKYVRILSINILKVSLLYG